MKHVPTLALGLAASALVVSFSLVAAPVGLWAAQEPSGSPADDPALPLFTQTCIKCHDSQRILQMRRTRPEWQEIINKMIEKGATGSGKEFETVFDYLVRHYGKVYINEAGANEIAKVLGLSPSEAAAIVSHRTANGAFADVETVKQVPGIDAKKLDGLEDAVAF
jgi:competence ComEA-like helix-hairpin-helix protein